MDKKLQDIIDKLYAEGSEKGRADAERRKADAEAAAARTIAEAKAEAERIVREAEAKAEDIKKNTLTEISLAGKQALAKIKEEIANLIIARSTGDALKSAALDCDFIKALLIEAAKNWNADSSKAELKALLPETLEKEFSERFAASADELLAAGIEVGYSGEVRSGFRIGEKNGGYYITFSDESFAAFMHGYLREKVSQMLFG